MSLLTFCFFLHFLISKSLMYFHRWCLLCLLILLLHIPCHSPSFPSPYLYILFLNCSLHVLNRNISDFCSGHTHTPLLSNPVTENGSPWKEIYREIIKKQHVEGWLPCEEQINWLTLNGCLFWSLNCDQFKLKCWVSLKPQIEGVLIFFIHVSRKSLSLTLVYCSW